MVKKYLIIVFIMSFYSINAQTLISQFDFLTTDLSLSTVGNSGVSYNTTDARLAAGGGVYFINSGGSVGLDLEIPRADFENISSVTFSFDYMRLESYATFFEMDYFKFHMNGGQIIIEYRVKDNASLITFNTGYYPVMNDRILLKVTYDELTGVMSVYDDATLKASNTTTAGKALDWPLTGNAFVGVQMDGSGSSTASLYQFQIYDEADASLPIELSVFRVDRLKDGNKIKWTTLSETNNSYFEIQRSSDNLSFETIGIVQGAGNSNKIIDYIFYDNSISNSTVYYRLKQTDFDGKFEFSKHIAVNNIYDNKVVLFPNPATKNEAFKIIAKHGDFIKIYNIAGQLVFAESYNSELRDVVIGESGIYFIIVYDNLGKELSSNKIIVK